MKFRKKLPDVYVEAIMIKDNLNEIAEFVGLSPDTFIKYYSISKGEWVLKYSNGNISIVTDQFIKDYYEPNNE